MSRGGARTGAGRKAQDTVLVSCRITREAREILDREAAAENTKIGAVLDRMIKTLGRP